MQISGRMHKTPIPRVSTAQQDGRDHQQQNQHNACRANQQTQQHNPPEIGLAAVPDLFEVQFRCIFIHFVSFGSAVDQAGFADGADEEYEHSDDQAKEDAANDEEDDGALLNVLKIAFHIVEELFCLREHTRKGVVARPL